ncbi:hypothetical protein HYS03_01945 [Candidatus Woesebacteria bacterium]|nr:hypothetical protein [Candidatus Woesebacteria bacterium]
MAIPPPSHIGPSQIVNALLANSSPLAINANMPAIDGEEDWDDDWDDSWSEHSDGPSWGDGDQWSDSTHNP